MGVTTQGSSTSDDLDTAIVAAVGVSPLVGLLDSPEPSNQAAAAAALAKLACSTPSKKYWRGEIAAAGALPGLQRVAGRAPFIICWLTLSLPAAHLPKSTGVERSLQQARSQGCKGSQVDAMPFVISNSFVVWR